MVQYFATEQISLENAAMQYRAIVFPKTQTQKPVCRQTFSKWLPYRYRYWSHFVINRQHFCDQHNSCFRKCDDNVNEY